jgi:hypothetical protein
MQHNRAINRIAIVLTVHIFIYLSCQVKQNADHTLPINNIRFDKYYSIPVYYKTFHEFVDIFLTVTAAVNESF